MVIAYKVYEHFPYKDGEDVVEDYIETDRFYYDVEPDEDDLFDFLELDYELDRNQKYSHLTDLERRFWRKGARFALHEIMRYECFDEEDHDFVEFLKDRYKEEALEKAKEYYGKEVDLR